VEIEKYWENGLDDVETENDLEQHEVSLKKPKKIKSSNRQHESVLPVPEFVLKMALSGKCPECLDVILNFAGRNNEH